MERINREKSELQQTISTLSKSLEDAEQYKWNTEIMLAKVKEKVLCVHVVILKYTLSLVLVWFTVSVEDQTFLSSDSYFDLCFLFSLPLCVCSIFYFPQL